MDNQGELIASKDMMDSLKLEASILTPQQDKQVKNVAKQASSEFTSMYSQFIPPTTLEKTKGMEDRILITDNDAFKTMYTNWDTIIVNPTPHDEEVRGTYFTQGRIMVFDNPDKLWGIYPKDVQESLIQKYGSAEKAKQLVVWVSLADNITHEVIHQFQNHNLPRPFLECAVRYYSRQVSDKLRIGHIIEDLSEERIGFYKQMVEQYGDKMHRLFFSGNIDTPTKDAILTRFNQETERLLPQEKGL